MTQAHHVLAVIALSAVLVLNAPAVVLALEPGAFVARFAALTEQLAVAVELVFREPADVDWKPAVAEQLSFSVSLALQKAAAVHNEPVEAHLLDLGAGVVGVLRVLCGDFSEEQAARPGSFAEGTRVAFAVTDAIDERAREDPLGVFPNLYDPVGSSVEELAFKQEVVFRSQLAQSVVLSVEPVAFVHQTSVRCSQSPAPVWHVVEYSARVFPATNVTLAFHESFAF